MRIAFQLAVKNLLGAGLRTWLNVGVLSFAFIVIIFYKSWIDGWNHKGRTDSIAWQYAYGHLEHEDYDPLDPFTFTDGHAELKRVPNGLEPVLVRQASIYPEGRMVPVILKGISIEQKNLVMPTHLLKADIVGVPAIIGDAMARQMQLTKGDEVLVRWRDANGTFDAANLTVVDVFENDVSMIDLGQVYIPIEQLWNMTNLPGHATFFVASEGYNHKEIEGWRFADQDQCLAEFDRIIENEERGGLVMQWLLLGIALLAIFDTQVLSVFRRQKEIGTFIALGMTRRQVVAVFTVEGAMNSIFAALLGGVYGLPLFAYIAKVGIPMPEAYEDIGMLITDRVFPVFNLTMIMATVLLVVVSATIVSYLPSRKIAKMNPVLALKGKIQ